MSNKMVGDELVSAAVTNDSEKLRAMLAHGVSPNVRDCNGWSALDSASFYGNVGIIEILIESGADVNSPCKDGNKGTTPLHYACMTGAGSNVVSYLLRSGANIDATDKSGETPLVAAVRIGCADRVNFLIEAGASLQVRGKLQHSGLNAPLVHIAAEGGHIDCLRLLAGAGIDLDELDDHGECALHTCARTNQIESLRFLAEIGACVDRFCKRTDFSMAAGFTALHVAAMVGNTDCIRVLSSLGASAHAVDASFEHGARCPETALALSASGGHVECVRELISLGIPIDGDIARGFGPLRSAVRRSRVDCVVEMINAGADLNNLDENHRPLFEFAKKEGWRDVVCAIERRSIKEDFSSKYHSKSESGLGI